MIQGEVKTVITTEDGSFGVKGMITDILPQFTSKFDQVFACGPLPMYRKMADMSSQLGIRPVQVLLEAVLGCGFGACLSCTIETNGGQKLVCKDGPVFALYDILWDKVMAPCTGLSCSMELPRLD
jgi:dihydroorotate dehydrogenase electron transfer subunit